MTDVCISCCECGSPFSGIRRLESHIAAIHLQSTMYKCSRCEFVYLPSEHALLQHSFTEHMLQTVMVDCVIEVEKKHELYRMLDKSLEMWKAAKMTEIQAGSAENDSQSEESAAIQQAPWNISNVKKELLSSVAFPPISEQLQNPPKANVKVELLPQQGGGVKIVKTTVKKGAVKKSFHPVSDMIRVAALRGAQPKMPTKSEPEPTTFLPINDSIPSPIVAAADNDGTVAAEGTIETPMSNRSHSFQAQMLAQLKTEGSALDLTQLDANQKTNQRKRKSTGEIKLPLKRKSPASVKSTKQEPELKEKAPMDTTTDTLQMPSLPVEAKQEIPAKMRQSLDSRASLQTPAPVEPARPRQSLDTSRIQPNTKLSSAPVNMQPINVQNNAFAAAKKQDAAKSGGAAMRFQPAQDFQAGVEKAKQMIALENLEKGGEKWMARFCWVLFRFTVHEDSLISMASVKDNVKDSKCLEDIEDRIPTEIYKVVTKTLAERQELLQDGAQQENQMMALTLKIVGYIQSGVRQLIKSKQRSSNKFPPALTQNYVSGGQITQQRVANGTTVPPKKVAESKVPSQPVPAAAESQLAGPTSQTIANPRSALTKEQAEKALQMALAQVRRETDGVAFGSDLWSVEFTWRLLVLTIGEAGIRSIKGSAIKVDAVKQVRTMPQVNSLMPVALFKAILCTQNEMNPIQPTSKAEETRQRNIKVKRALMIASEIKKRLLTLAARNKATVG